MSLNKKTSLSRSSMSILDLRGISFKVIIIGQSNVGKTSLIHKYIHGQFLKQYNITVGVDFKSKTVQLQDRFIQLQIWDTCGQQIYRSVVSSFYRGASAVFLVYAVDNRKSFQNLDIWNDNFDKQGSNQSLKFLIGTKCDLQRAVTTQQAKQYMKKINGSFFIQTSAFNGQNIQQVFLCYYKTQLQLFQKAASALYKNFQVSQRFRRLVKPDSDSVVDGGSIRLEKGEEGQMGEYINEKRQSLKKKKNCCS